MDVHVFNNDPDLIHSPQGRLFVTPQASATGMPMVHQVTPSGAVATIGVVDKEGGRNVFHGLYGNRPWELVHILDQAEKERLLKEQDKAREALSASTEFKAQLRRALAGSVNPAEEMEKAMAMVRHGKRFIR